MKFKKSLKILAAGLVISPLLWMAYISIGPLFGTVKVISTLKTDITADLASNTSLFLQPIIDTIDSLEVRPATCGFLAGAISVDALTFTDAPLASVAKVGQWVIPEVYTTDAEMRRIDSIAGSVITVSRAFVRAHAVGDSVHLSDDGQRNIIYWAADPTSSDISANVQAAIDDFDYRLDTSIENGSATFTGATDTITSSAHGLEDTETVFLTNSGGALPSPLAINTHYFLRDKATNTFKVATSPNGTAISGITGGSGTHTWHKAYTLQANNLFFPAGLWTVGATITLPDTENSHNLGTAIYGRDAVIRTTSFTGPIFSGASVRISNITGGNNLYTFHDLKFRDETNLGSTGTSKVFNHTFNRLRLHNCSFDAWGWIIKSDDTTDMTLDYIQSTRISECEFTICDFIVEVSKAFDFSFVNNQTSFCNKVVHCVGTTDSGMIVGRICGNIFEGSGNGGHTILIKGPNALTIDSNYFEANGDTTNPEIDFKGGTQPRGITITGNGFQPTTGQKADTTWFPIEMAPTSEAIVITGNWSLGGLLIDPRSLHSAINVQIDNNWTRFSEPQSWSEQVDFGGRTVTRRGNITTASATPTNMEFGDNAPAFSIAYSGSGSVFAVEARVTAIEDTTRDEVVKYAITALFRERANEQAGAHSAGTSATIMTDGGESFVTDEFIGSRIYNITDGSSGIVTDNDGDTVTVAALIGGNDQQWENLDTYRILRFGKIGTTQLLHPNIETFGAAAGAGWSVDLVIVTESSSLTADFPNDLLLDNSHGLENDDVIYFDVSGGTMPTPLVANEIYYVVNKTTNNFQVSRSRNSTEINLSDNGTASIRWHQDDIHLEVTGEASTTIDWWGEVKIQIGPDV